MRLLLLLTLLTAVATAQPPPEDSGFPPPEPGGEPPPIQRLMQHWKERNPEEFERMKALREQDPAAFRRELQRKLAEARETHSQGRRLMNEMGMRGGPGGPGDDREPMSPEMRAAELQIRQLAEAWRKATAPEEKERLTAELKVALSKAFDQREQMRAQRLADMEKKLNELRTVMDERRSRRDAIIEKRLQELTDGAKLAW